MPCARRAAPIRGLGPCGPRRASLCEHLPVGHHELLRARERLLLHLAVRVGEELHEGLLGAKRADHFAAVRVVLDEGAQVVARNREGGGGRVGALDHVHEGGDHLVVALAKLGHVLLPELGVFVGRAPLEGPGEHLRLEHVEGAQRGHVRLQGLGELRDVLGDVLVGPPPRAHLLEEPHDARAHHLVVGRALARAEQVLEGHQAHAGHLLLDRDALDEERDHRELRGDHLVRDGLVVAQAPEAEGQLVDELHRGGLGRLGDRRGRAGEHLHDHGHAVHVRHLEAAHVRGEQGHHRREGVVELGALVHVEAVGGVELVEDPLGEGAQVALGDLVRLRARV
mmetsp:Transcript_10886/g.36990  ORF Transcript_10886/g.36990 Transcript_10886/m.36990 type:complete len:339 (-) Transcript_10886:188-1204(-)